MGLNVAIVNLQPHDQNIWDSVFEGNSILGWLHGTLDTCSGWGRYPGGQGSSKGGNMTIWEGMQNSDSKFL